MTPSWVEAANRADSDFPLDNLPWCRYNGGRAGVAIGDLILDVRAAGVDAGDRVRLTRMLAHDAINRPPERALTRQADAKFELPFDIGDYTDFYASIHHATNVGKLFRPENPLLPNYTHLPVGYHGRASSVVVSGTPVRRPCGQLGEGRFGPSEQLDYELELGVFIGKGNSLGEPVPLNDAEDHIAGFVLVNDWSARDIQKWEYQPLGPFLGKSFATSVSPWVVTREALEPYRIPGAKRSHWLPYLSGETSAWEITLEVEVNGLLIGRSRAAGLYWTFGQMIAHHTSNGCNLRRGDLLASGTVSGEGEQERGCLLETGLAFLRDGDEVAMRGYAAAPGKPRIGFGECRGTVARTFVSG